MTDPIPDQGPDGRAERALRDALTRRSADLEPRALPTVRRRSAVLPVVAAAAAVALVVGLGVAWTAQQGADPEAPSAAETSVTAPPPRLTDVAKAPLESRRIGFLDVEVDVPREWADGDAPTSQWCVAGNDDRPSRSDFPTRPYVARDRSTAASGLVACGGEVGQPAAFPPVPPVYWAPHLSLLPRDTVGVEEGTQTFREWTLTTRFVGAVAVQLLTDEATTPLADTIVGSAVVRDVDANGCDVTSPIQAREFVRPPAADVTAIEQVTSIAVCQYTRGRPDAPGLIASRVLEGDDARAELTAIQQAPVGGGPDDPERCSADSYGDQAIVLRLRDLDAAEIELYVYYDWCFGNGVDDGTTRRAITRANCDPLWGDPVFQYSGGSTVFGLCHPENTAG